MSFPGVTDCPSTRFVKEPPSTLTSTSKYCVLVLLFVILSCGVAKPLEHAVRVALNVGENGSYAINRPYGTANSGYNFKNTGGTVLILMEISG